jgi:predicted membrane protein
MRPKQRSLSDMTLLITVKFIYIESYMVWTNSRHKDREKKNNGTKNKSRITLFN